jgi:hypothetical protein
VKCILKHARFVNARANARGALFAAAVADDVALVDLLFTYVGGDINIHNQKREPLLVFSCLHGARSVVEYVINAPGFNAIPSGGARVLAAALRLSSPHTTAILEVLARTTGFDINAPLPQRVNGTRYLRKATLGEATGQRLVDIAVGVPFLTAAIRVGRADVVQVLLGLSGLDPTVKLRVESRRCLIWRFVSQMIWPRCWRSLEWK